MSIKSVKFDYSESTQEDVIRFSKTKSAINARCRKKLGKINCFICNQSQKIINSHSIPEFILRKISVNGELYSSAGIIDAPIIGDLKGLNKAGTFGLLCSDCDKKWFADYEEPSNYQTEPNGKMLAQIAMKTYLKEIYKKITEIIEWEDEFYTLPDTKPMEDPSDMHEMFCRWQQYKNKVFISESHKQAAELDLEDFLNKFNYSKAFLDTDGKTEGYYLHFYQRLNYVVPVATQVRITLMGGFNDEVINTLNDENKYSHLHICIFPMDTFSIVMLFTKNNELPLRPFLRTFKKMPLPEQLQVISYILFTHSEEIYINKETNKILKDSPLVVEMGKISGITWSTDTTDPFQHTLERIKQQSLTKRHGFPNLLSEEYKLS